MTVFRTREVAIALSIACGAVSSTGCTTHRSPPVPGSYSFKRMADGREWLTENVNVNVAGSYCYQDDELMCRRYGRLYTWGAAQRACRSLQGGWRLPTDEEWRLLAKPYGGAHGDSADDGKSAYASLLKGGNSGFDALLGGGRAPDRNDYDRLEAHGFYWTASESGPPSAVFFNFGSGGQALHRQPEGEKPRAFSVRCVRG